MISWAFLRRLVARRPPRTCAVCPERMYAEVATETGHVPYCWRHYVNVIGSHRRYRL